MDPLKLVRDLVSVRAAGSTAIDNSLVDAALEAIFQQVCAKAHKFRVLLSDHAHKAFSRVGGSIFKCSGSIICLHEETLVCGVITSTHDWPAAVPEAGRNSIDMAKQLHMTM